MDLVHKMMLDANRTGVFLLVNNLLSRNEPFQKELADIFAEARALAGEKSISLKLPEMVPKADRRCEFIETGSAMVSWDGNVFPCNFLWHKFNCYHKTRVVCREIEARTFGNPGKAMVHDIWNDPGGGNRGMNS